MNFPIHTRGVDILPPFLLSHPSVFTLTNFNKYCLRRSDMFTPNKHMMLSYLTTIWYTNQHAMCIKTPGWCEAHHIHHPSRHIACLDLLIPQKPAFVNLPIYYIQTNIWLMWISRFKHLTCVILPTSHIHSNIKLVRSVPYSTANPISRWYEIPNIEHRSKHLAFIKVLKYMILHICKHLTCVVLPIPHIHPHI